MKAKMAAGRPARRSDPPVSLKTQTQFSSWTIALGCVFQPDGSLRPAALPAAIFAFMHGSLAATKSLQLRGDRGQLPNYWSWEESLEELAVKALGERARQSSSRNFV